MPSSGRFEPFPAPSYGDAIRLLAERDPIRPYVSDEAGLAGYRPATFYLIHDRIGVDERPLYARHGVADAFLHTHPVSSDAFFPTGPDLVNGKANGEFILSRDMGTFYVTKYTFGPGLILPAGGQVRWPRTGTGVPFRARSFDGLVRYVAHAPMQPVMRAESSGAPFCDVLALPVLMQLHGHYGDDLFYDPRLDWYEAGRRL